MRYWAYNRKTGHRYGPVTEAEKQAFQATPSTNVFRYEQIQPTMKAEKPEEVKPAATTKAKPKRQTKSKSKSGDNDNING